MNLAYGYDSRMLSGDNGSSLATIPDWQNVTGSQKGIKSKNPENFFSGFLFMLVTDTGIEPVLPP
ncbi:hypothetical protein GK108_06890 [Spirosoma terrae]|uniref:Uncharacterized protein n=1 Tax=Spirosoma terrae TaxID=1968276 RepID=A0A6L9L236_9BACT|nr:hypothetical protein [Spirosoma terrae]